MTSGELATLARRRGGCRGEGGSVPPRATPEERVVGRNARVSAGGSADESAAWEASYAAVVRTEQRDTAALLAFLDDARAAKLEATRRASATLSARRCGAQEARARGRPETGCGRTGRRRRRGSWTSAERDRRVVGEALRRGRGSAARRRFAAARHDVRGGSGTTSARAPAGRNYRRDDEGDRDDEDVGRPPTPRSRAPREPAARTRDAPAATTTTTTTTNQERGR